MTATVACVKDFGEQVIVTVKSLDNAEASAQCTVDYVEKIIGFTFNMPKIANIENTFTYDIETSNYTLKSEISFNISNRLVLTEAFKEQFASYFQGYGASSNEYSAYVICAPAYLGTRNNNVLFIEDSGEWNYLGDPDDYIFCDNLVGCFYGIDSQYLEQSIGDLGMPTRVFRETINKITTAHATFEISYSAIYNGIVYSSGSKTIDVKFDGEALHIPVTSLSLSNGSLVF